MLMMVERSDDVSGVEGDKDDGDYEEDGGLGEDGSNGG